MPHPDTRTDSPGQLSGCPLQHPSRTLPLGVSVWGCAVREVAPGQKENCPRCRAANAYHVIGDRWHCPGCRHYLRLVDGSSGPAFVPLIVLPWERPQPKARA